MINNSPCFNCAARSPDCHSTCNLYISWKEQKQKENDQIRKQRYNEYLVSREAYREEYKK